nr:helix-turn-helix transcriptional regulator [uncultured Gellertiella sp.]
MDICSLALKPSPDASDKLLSLFEPARPERRVLTRDAIADQIIEACIRPELWPAVLETISVQTESHGAYLAPSDFFPALAVELGFPVSSGLLESPLSLDTDRSGRRVTDRGRAPLAARGPLRKIPLQVPDGSPAMQATADTRPLCLHLVREQDLPPRGSSPALMIDHLLQALEVAMGLAHRLATRSMADLLDGFSLSGAPVVLIGRSGRILAANPQAEAFFDRDIRQVNGELTGSNASETLLLRNRIRRCLTTPLAHARQDPPGLQPERGRRKMTAAPHGTTASAPAEIAPVAFTREGRRPLLVSLKWLERPPYDLVPGPVLAGLLIDLGDQKTPSADCLRGIFGLTAQEYVIAGALACGYGAKEISENRQMNYETVRSHVKSIMRKTGVSRQSEITALLSALARA